MKFDVVGTLVNLAIVIVALIVYDKWVKSRVK